MNRRLAWRIVAAIVVLNIAAWFAFRPYWQVEPLPVLSELGGDFTLPSTLGREAKLSEFADRLVLLNFGFASCPDVCPATLARMRDVLAQLGDRGPLVQPLFVTVDPGRDTVERLAPYVGYFGPTFVGMTGTAEQVAQVAALYKVFYERQPIASEMEYTINHTAHVYLLDRQGRVRAAFGQSASVAEMVAAVRRLLDTG